MKRLPIKLTTEPLVDVICEIRFAHKSHAANILLSTFFTALGHDLPVSNTQILSLPEAMRTIDQNLKYQPLMLIDWAGVQIGLGDASVAIMCKIPYPGWIALKEKISQVFQILKSSQISFVIERCALKYVNIIPGGPSQALENKLAVDIRLSERNLALDPFHLKFERREPDDSMIHIVTLSSAAKVTLNNGTEIHGALIDVDTVSLSAASNWADSLDVFNIFLEKIHQNNKTVFIDCLTDAALNELGPIYE